MIQPLLSQRQPAKVSAMSLSVHPLRIGELSLDLPVILAPLAGYTDQPFRMICRQLGAPYCATEMMLDKSLLINQKLRNRLVQPCEGDSPMAGQLIGNTPEEMAAAAVELVKMGLDVIDLNFACPVRKALSRRRGGYLMSEPDLAVEITRAVIAAVDVPVTIKIRRSFEQEDTTCDEMWRILDGAFAAGAAMACIHTRSVRAMYRGKANWDLLGEIKRRYPDQTIIGSGDVKTAAHAVSMLTDLGLDGVLAARGALGNPWFFRQVADLLAGREAYQPDLAEQRDIMKQHFDRAVEVYGADKGPRIMRKFGIKYAHLHPTPKVLRVAFVNVKAPEEWHAVVDQYYR
jgi:tRNA-dihydrouridine synthase B